MREGGCLNEMWRSLGGGRCGGSCGGGCLNEVWRSLGGGRCGGSWGGGCLNEVWRSWGREVWGILGRRVFE